MRAMTLEEMKAVELEIMDEINTVYCRQHGLTYFLGYGSIPRRRSPRRLHPLGRRHGRHHAA